MKKRRPFLMTISLVAVSLLAIGFVLLNVQDPDLTEQDHINQIRSDLVKQIHNYEDQATNSSTIVKPLVSSKKKSSSTSNIYQAQLTNTDGSYSTVSTSNEMAIERSSKRNEMYGPLNSNPNRNTDWLQNPSAIDQIVAAAQAASRDWTFAWLQLSHPLSQELVAQTLAEQDMEIMGFAGDLVRLKVTSDRERLVAVTELPWVTGFGPLPSTRKFNSALVQQISDTSPDPLPVYITVVASDMQQEFRRELKRLGVATGHFDPAVRALAATVDSSQLELVSKLDFVQSIEPIEVVGVSHDSAIPQLGADGLRVIGSQNGIYEGISGVSTPVAVMDTGLNTSHVSISELRKSVCGENFVGFEDEDLWFDANGHGTHVTGTLAGRGLYQPLFAGVAPGVEHIRFAKVLSSFGFGDTLGIMRAMDYLGEETTCGFKGVVRDPVKPLVVNMSLSATSLTFDSRTVSARKLDSIVWTRKQVYVVANANSNIYGYSDFSSAKNSLAVAMAWDSGDIAYLSSRGPSFDGRLLPLITGTGVNVVSTEGAGAWDTYVSASGTSMASPSVAGVVALLMDASHDHREQPALVRAQLMASAIKPDSWFESDSVFPRNNTNGPGSIQAEYGMGLASARTSILNNESENGWMSSGVSVEVEHGDTAYTDIVVPEGAGRVDIVMTWDEPATDTIANAVLNDLNLWVDYLADCGVGPCGEHSSRSAIDNVEWIILNDPEPGIYRVKVDAARVYTEAPRVGLAWTIIKADSSPKLTLEAREQIFESPNGQPHEHDVELTLTTDSYVASGTRLHIDCRTLDGGACGKIGYKRRNDATVSRRFGGQIQREDGIERIVSEQSFLSIGEVALGETQDVIVHLSTEITEPVWIYFTVSSWNGDGDSTAVLFRPAANDDEQPAIDIPVNTTFEKAVTIVGNRGTYEFDPLRAWTEGGEPTLLTTRLRPGRSVWFKWEPDQTGLVTFQVTPRFRDNELLNGHAPLIDVFQISDDCCGPGASPRVASSVWSAQLFALEGYEYRVRVSHNNASMPLTLNWVRGERPRNDHFANAIALAGSSGEVSGTNLGATLETGELYGQLASTVWYEWTAPENGSWQFQIEDTLVVQVLAFVGNNVQDLRLVSNVARPGAPIRFPAKQGSNYQIMVASPSANAGGWSFDKLSWEKIDATTNSNDMFENASSLDGVQRGSRFISTGSGSNVEPDEPVASGIQTRWWKWRAPATGTFTWYWNDKTLDVVVFSGDSFARLLPSKKTGGISSAQEFALDATQDEEYWFSLGRKKHEFLAYIPGIVSSTTLNWGNTPENNTLDGAVSLSGARGSQDGTVQYATTEVDGLSDLGDSSLWYTYEVAETGWKRFYLDGSASQPTRISAFSRSAENQDLELIMSSRVAGFFSNDPVEIYVYGEAGTSIILRIASSMKHSTNSFTLRWEPSTAPQWLRYLGRVAHGRRDGSGNIAKLPAPGESVFNGDGTAFYIATQSGLNIFSRNPETGELTFENETNDIDPKSFLLWDFHRSRLYANHEDVWWIYEPMDEDPLKLDLVSIQYGLGTARTQNTYGTPSLYMEPEGNYVYRTLANEQTVYSFDTESNLVYRGDFAVPRRAIYPTQQANDWYSTNNNTIFLDRRIVGSAFFERNGTHDLSGRSTRIIDSDDSGEYVFVADTYIASLLRNDLNTGELSTLASDFNFSLGVSDCGGIYVRSETLAADVICGQGAYVVDFDSESNDIDFSDHFVNANFFFRVKDRFGRLVPPYSLTESRSVTASPDGKHLYASTRNHGVLMFERFGNPVIESNDQETQTEPKRLDSLQASPNRIQFGDETALDGCLPSNNWTVDGVVYRVASSKWQERSLGSEWADIEGTLTYLQLCSYDPGEENEYRMVAQLAVEGTLVDYSSNFFANPSYNHLASLVVESGSVTLNNSTYTECTTVLDSTINEVVYSVANSKWQSRENEDSPWIDINGTETAGELCPYEPKDDQEYRLVSLMTVAGERGFRHSNYITK